MYIADLLKLSALVALLAREVSSAPTYSSSFTFYDLPEPLSGPCDLCEGPDGALWGQDQLVNELFRIDPETGKIETFTIPFTSAPIGNVTLPTVLGRTAFSCAIRPGQDGNIYSAFGTRNQLVRINPKTKKIDLFADDRITQPIGDLQPFNDLYSSPDGIFFTQTTANLISFFDFATETIKDFEVPTPGGSPLGMFFASDGKAYFAELLGNKIGRLDPVTGHIEEFDVPLPALAGPAVIRAETENKYVWFTAFFGNGIGRLDMETGEVKAYPNPSLGTFAAEDTVDKDGNIWFSTATQNLLNKLDPQTGEFSQVVMPGTTVVAPASVPLYFVIAMNYGPGNALWFTEETVNRVGRYELP